MHWDYVAIIVFIGVLVPWRSRARVQLLFESRALASAERLRLYLSTMAFQWAIAGFIAWRFLAHGGHWSTLGLTLAHPFRVAVATIPVSLLLVCNQVLSIRRLSGVPVEGRGIVGRLADLLLPRTRSERWVALALVLTVALCEEFIYRGFVEYLFASRLSSVLAGAVISAAFFAAAHLYQGRRGLVATFIMGLIFSLVRTWTSTLLGPMIIHFVVDFSAGAASLRMLGPQAATGARTDP